MRLIIVAPYKNPVVNWGFVIREFIDDMRKSGQLDGVEVDLDEGFEIGKTSDNRESAKGDGKFKIIGMNEEDLASIALGAIKKAREYSESGKYDAIVFSGFLDPGFAAARLVSKIPVAGAIHSAVHMASLIGDRCGIIHGSRSSSLIVRHAVEAYGFGHKVASVRFHEYSPSFIHAFLNKYPKEERLKNPEARKVFQAITNHCIAAIEKDRVDTLIIGSEPSQALAGEVRQWLDEAGYDEIPMIRSLPAAVEMAKAMVNTKLRQTARAYPSHSLKAKPEYW